MTGTLPHIPGLGVAWGGKSEKLRSKAPKLHAMVTGYGQPFIVRRAGVPDVEVIAFLWQSKPGGKTEVQDPGFTVLGSEALFLPDAPVLRPGFVLLDMLTGRAYTPDNDVQDIAGQHVLLWGRFTPYAEHTRLDLLTFEVATAELREDPRSGNMLPVTRKSNVPVRLAASRDPETRELVADADPAALVFVGRWGSLLEPCGRPDGIDWGDTAPLTVDGQPGTLTVRLAYPDADSSTEAVFGARFVATWEATAGTR